MYKFILAISLIFFINQGFAETCPSVNHIKANSLHGWKLYDNDDNTPLSSKRVAYFKKNVDQFVLAQWTSTNHKNGAIHCFYRDKDGSELEAYLAKDNFYLQTAGNYWYQVSGFMHCAADAEK